MACLRGNALVIGAMKSGTTSIFRWLSSVPSIAPSRRKDTKFFLHEAEGGSFSRGLGWYAEQFPDCSQPHWRLEASTHYAKYPYYTGVPKRIRETLDNPALVYVVRNPLSRTLSHWFHNLVVDGSVSDINTCLSCFDSKYYHYSDYALQLSQYYRHFERNIIFIADITDDAASYESMINLLDFLDIQQPGTQTFRPILDKANSLISNINYRTARSPFHATADNQRAFNRLRAILSSNPDIDLIDLALRFGLDEITLERMVIRLNKKVAELEHLSGTGWQKWIVQHETYLQNYL